LAVGVRGYHVLKGFSYTISIFAAVTIAMFYPSYFVEFNGFQLKNLIVPYCKLLCLDGNSYEFG
jgi:BASS family bile acid:Na+ symporter